MAQAELSNILKKVTDSSGQFKQAANENNRNVSKITKDLSGVVFSQKKEISELSSSIQESISVSGQTSSKIEQTNSLLQQSISIQNSMLTQLKSIAAALSSKDKEGEGGGDKSLFSKFGKILGTTAIAGAAGAAGYGLAGGGQQKNSGEGIDLNKKFSDLSEEEKTRFLEKQTKAEGVGINHPELNNPGAIQFGEHAKKFGAEAGTNNGTITLSKFPSMEKGKEAQRALWESPNYSNLTLDQGLNKWVTGKETSSAPESYKKVFTQGSPAGDESKSDSGKKQKNEQSGSMVKISTKDGSASAQVAAEYATNFQGFIDALEAAGYKIKSLGGFADRNIAGTNTPSWHSKGMAIDINPESNPVTFGEPGRKPKTNLPDNVGEIAAKFGLGWGGAWDGEKQDAMHFSLGEGPGAMLRGKREEAGLGKNGGSPSQAGGGQTPSSSGSPSTASGSPTGSYMGGAAIPFQPGRIGMGGMGGFGGMGAGGLIGGLVSSLLSPSSSQASFKEDAPRPQTTAAKGSFTPTFAAPGSSEDTSANFFAADKANTAKLLKEKATEETVRKQRAEEATVAKTEAPKEQTQEQQASGKSSPAPFKPDHEMFGKGDWAGDLLRYFGVKSSIA